MTAEQVIWSACRRVLLSVVGIGLLPAAEAQSNSVVIENQQPGSSQWQIFGTGATDVGGQVMSVTTGLISLVGTYALTITGVSGPLTHTTTVTLVVTLLTMRVSPPSWIVTCGILTSPTANPADGFHSSVGLRLNRLLSGVKGSAVPNPGEQFAPLSAKLRCWSTVVGDEHEMAD